MKIHSGIGTVEVVDPLTVLKALGDETRYAMYEELAMTPRALSAAELAERLELHPNTVRLHLERLREAGIVEAEAVHRGTVGRPQHRYSLAAGAPGLGLDPPAHVVLAGLLAALAEQYGVSGADATAIGRRWGDEAARRTRTTACLGTLAEQLDTLGFDPYVDSEPEPDEPIRIDFMHCPFRELAEAYPELVCNLHRGLCEGIVENRGGGSIHEFATLYDPEPCHVTVKVT